jgi:hypothetical protein
MTKARQFVYQFDDQNEPEEIVIDMRGEQEVPKAGHIITRLGKQWKVVHTEKQEGQAPDGPIPVHFITLTASVEVHAHAQQSNSNRRSSPGAAARF